jgi:FlaA1/EpsC-like NDP-sugar epimerase
LISTNADSVEIERAQMPEQLQGKCILITGGAQGTGLECARAYVREGARVAIADASVFLLLSAARFIAGCILPVSGGGELGYRL